MEMDLYEKKRVKIPIKKSNSEMLIQGKSLLSNVPILTLPSISKRGLNEKCNSTSKIFSCYSNVNTLMKMPPKKIYKRSHVNSTNTLLKNNNNFAVRTSITHPLNISWITPINTLINTYQKINRQLDADIGKLALSSCPGKKVRLNTGPINGRAAISRDLDLDLKRLSEFNIKTIVCCLNDAELQYLGSPWKLYSEKAKDHKIDILRLPIIEGSCPESICDVDILITEMVNRAKAGINILCHCRGGIGRAGLIACCFLLKLGYTTNPLDAIKIVRAQRSPQAIETKRQEDFIIHYANWIKSQNNNNSTITCTTTNSLYI